VAGSSDSPGLSTKGLTDMVLVKFDAIANTVLSLKSFGGDREETIIR
jgi:hypothetical protein